MTHRIDATRGSDLGLTGRHADMPAFQIVNETRDLFLVLTSRLVGLEYGLGGDGLRAHPLWPGIKTEHHRVAEDIAALGSNAAVAAALASQIRGLDEAVTGLLSAQKAGGATE